MEDGRIRTQFDDLISNLQDSGGEPQSIRKLAKLLETPDKMILNWAHILEKDGKVELINRFDGIYISWIALPELHDEKERVYEPAPREASHSFSSELRIAKEHEDKARNTISGKAIPTSESDERAAIESAIEKLEAPSVPLSKEDEADLDAGEKTIEQSGMTIEKIDAARKDLSSLESDLSSMEHAIEKLEKLNSLETEIAVLNSEIESNERKKAEKQHPLPKPPEIPVPSRQVDSADSKSPQVQTQLHESGELIVPVSLANEAQSQKEPAEKRGKRQKYPSRMQKIEKGAAIELTELSLSFSDRMHRQLAKIEKAAREVEALRADKEKLLNEHYLPMERKLESELETIGDRIMMIEDRVFSLQKRAADLPAKVWSLERVQASTIGAHDQMRRAYDEAAAVIEESGLELAEELGKMEELAEQARAEISSHSSKTNELQATLERINQFEGDLNYKISIARDALTDQAGKLASAEKYSQELSSFREEIRENVTGIRREMGATKAMLTELERQMEQVRHIHQWTNSVKGDYDAKMQEVDDYIKNGNHEFETLREAVEARFVRKYLSELRNLSESYTFELGEARQAELTIDQKVESARARLSRLIEEGQTMAYKYESSAKIPDDSQELRKREASFADWQPLDARRTTVEQMIAEVVGKRAEYRSETPRISAKPAQNAQQKPRKAKPRKGRKGGKR